LGLAANRSPALPLAGQRRDPPDELRTLPAALASNLNYAKLPVFSLAPTTWAN